MDRNPSSAREHFTASYAGNAPWDTGRPQPPFLTIADQVKSPVLDAGCGTGSTSVFFAARGQEVTGIDFVDEAINRARAKAGERKLNVEFMVKDAMTLGAWDRRFATVIDSGLFHVYSGEERKKYAAGLANVIKPDGHLFLYAFSDEEPAAPGGGISVQDLHNSFSEGWEVESVQSIRGELNPAFVAEFPNQFPKEGPLMRFAVIRRTA
jgi:2-polyprenyl-3-methyl-5-hydroxy-6-metoxy-1,4-benzoquinol methylase